MSKYSDALFEEAARLEGVTGTLKGTAFSVYGQESGRGRNTKTSNAGAHGGMQIIPGTFAEVADKGWDINNPLHNLRAGLRYLKKLDKMSGGDPYFTAIGYYSGPGGMQAAMRGEARYDKRNPNAPSSLEYGRQVVARMKGQLYVPSQQGQGHPPMQSHWATDTSSMANPFALAQSALDDSPSRPAESQANIPLNERTGKLAWSAFNEAMQPKEVVPEVAPVQQPQLDTAAIMQALNGYGLDNGIGADTGYEYPQEYVPQAPSQASLRDIIKPYVSLPI